MAELFAPLPGLGMCINPKNTPKSHSKEAAGGWEDLAFWLMGSLMGKLSSYFAGRAHGPC